MESRQGMGVATIPRQLRFVCCVLQRRERTDPAAPDSRDQERRFLRGSAGRERHPHLLRERGLCRHHRHEHPRPRPVPAMASTTIATARPTIRPPRVATARRITPRHTACARVRIARSARMAPTTTRMATSCSLTTCSFSSTTSSTTSSWVPPHCAHCAGRSA